MSKIKRIVILGLCLSLLSLGGFVAPGISADSTSEYIARYKSNLAAYNKHEVPLIKSFRANYDGSLADQIVARAIWYMENGYMVYGHSNYVKDGRVDCSNFTSLVYKDFGIKIPTASRSYNQVGTKVPGVYSKLQSGSTKKYMLVGVNNLKPGDLFTYWKTDSKGNRYIAHTAIYMGKLNGKPAIIHTISGRPTAIGITTSFTWWYGQHFLEARRVLPDSAYKPNKPVVPQKYQLPPQKTVKMPQGI